MKWDTNKKDMLLINDIAKRACAQGSMMADKQQLDMDITACHLNGTRLNLEKFLKADEGNFLHDIYGIQRHINRDTGKLENCFSPRYSA